MTCTPHALSNTSQRGQPLFKILNIRRFRTAYNYNRVLKPIEVNI